jgi:hypothetical protein
VTAATKYAALPDFGNYHSGCALALGNFFPTVPGFHGVAVIVQQAVARFKHKLRCVQPVT